MSIILYKRLFEIRILHDFYLSKADGTGIYEMAPAQKSAFLMDQVKLGHYDVQKFLKIQETENTSQIFKNFHLKMATEPWGFVVGIEVKPRPQPTGEIKYLPFIPGVQNQKLGFKLTLIAKRIKQATNNRLQVMAPYSYYFNNLNPGGVKAFPSLSLPVADFQAGKPYETSELAVIGGNVSQALEDTTNADPAKWQVVNESGLANEQDRILIGKQFNYRLPNPATNITAKLSDLSGAEVKTLNHSSSQGFSNAIFDFRFTGSDENRREVPDGDYQLEVRADGFMVENKTIKLSDDLHQHQLGSIEMLLKEADANFRLFNTDGSLITQNNADNSINPHPVFEIRLKRRSTYWCYRSASGKNLLTTPKSTLFLDQDGGLLKTKALKPLTFFPTEFQSDDPGTPAINERVFLPNPNTNVLRKENKRLFSDIYVSPIKELIQEN